MCFSKALPVLPKPKNLNLELETLSSLKYLPMYE